MPESGLQQVPWPEFDSQLDAALARIRTMEHRRSRSKRALIAAVVTAALLAGALSTVGSVRGAFLRLFSFGGERIELVDRLEPLADPRPLSLGPATTLDEARARTTYRLALPELDLTGAPTTVHVTGRGGVTQVALLWGSENDFRLLLTEVPLTDILGLHERLIAQKRLTTPPVNVSVNGTPGLWLEGFHEYVYISPTGDQRFSRPRLARNVLLWHVGGLQLRLEGRMTRQQALEIARTVRTETDRALGA
jgi:hypothetical protein